MKIENEPLIKLADELFRLKLTDTPERAILEFSGALRRANPNVLDWAISRVEDLGPSFIFGLACGLRLVELQELANTLKKATKETDELEKLFRLRRQDES